jgi:hypothetical protein
LNGNLEELLHEVPDSVLLADLLEARGLVLCEDHHGHSRTRVVGHLRPVADPAVRVKLHVAHRASSVLLDVNLPALHDLFLGRPFLAC